MRTLYGRKLTLSERWCRATLALVVAVSVGASGTLAGSDLLPAASALPCPDGSQTCGPQPTQDPGPTQGNQAPTTAPQAPQTTIPPNTDTGGPTPPTNGNPGFQGTVQAMPTPDNPNGCIVNCGPTATQGANRPPATAEARPSVGGQQARPEASNPGEANDHVQYEGRNGKNNSIEECYQALSEVNKGQPISNIDQFASKWKITTGPRRMNFAVNTAKYENEANAAIDSWRRALDGKFEFNAYGHQSIVQIPIGMKTTIQDKNKPGADWSGEHNAITGTINLNEAYLDKLSASERQAVVAHEIGHALGLEHSCNDTVMNAFPGPMQAVQPSRIDVQAVTQLWGL